MEIAGSRVLLTGASGGLGEAIARDLAARGAKLVISARRVAELDALAADIGAEVLVADLANRSDLAQVIEASRDVDVLIANAGVGSDSVLEEMTADEVDFVIDVNLRAPILMATEFATSHLRDGRPGQIVFIGSLSGIAATANTRMYNATKFGLRGFSLSLREDLIDSGVGVTIVAPGFIREAGMFATSEIDLPPGVRTKKPADVAAGVRRAIERNPAEVFVAPAELRAAATLASTLPGFSSAVQRKIGVAERTARTSPQ